MPGLHSYSSTQDSDQLAKRIPLALIGRQFGLSKRELEVIQGFFSRETESDAGRRLELSRHTVHAYVKRIYFKLGANDHCSVVVRIFEAYLALTLNGSSEPSLSEDKATNLKRRPPRR